MLISEEVPDKKEETLRVGQRSCSRLLYQGRSSFLLSSEWVRTGSTRGLNVNVT